MIFAAKVLPEEVRTADAAIRHGESTASAFADVDAATVSWHRCLKSLAVEKTLFSDKRDYERHELLRSLAHPERITAAYLEQAGNFPMVWPVIGSA